MKFDHIKKSLTEVTTPKSSKKIEEFGEVYSAILLGMHSDINQYKRQVDKTQKFLSSVDQKLEAGVQRMEGILLQIQQSKIEMDKKEEEIQQVHWKMESLYNSFSMTASEIGAFKQQLEITANNYLQQQRIMEETLVSITELKETAVKQEEEIKLFKKVVLLVSVVVVFLLFFVVWRY